MNAAVHPEDSPDVVVTRAGPAGWQRLRDVRLAALSESPEMFSSSLAREHAFDAAEWRRRASRPATFIASRVGVDVGIAGVYEFDDGGSIAGMWIAPAARGTGVFEALIRACESVAQGAGAPAVTLGVMEDNPRGRAPTSASGTSSPERGSTCVMAAMSCS